MATRDKKNIIYVKIIIIFALRFSYENIKKSLIIHIAKSGKRHDWNAFVFGRGIFFMKLIPLTKGLSAKVDDDLFDELSKFKWCAKLCKQKGRNDRYDAVRRNPENGKNIFMHRQILGLSYKDGFVGDHINHDTLDYQKSNLRICTQLQNTMNCSIRKNASSKYKGVSIAKRGVDIYWRATITVSKKLKSLGYFPFTQEGEINAALKYNSSAKENFGEYANLNIL